MKQYDLFIDCDGVLVDTIKRTYEQMKNMGINLTFGEDEDRKKKYYADLDWDELLAEKDIELKNAIIACTKIYNDPRFRSFNILTNINSLSEGISKVKYFNNNYPKANILLTPYDVKKSDMTASKDSIIIDDSLRHIKDWNEKRGLGILYGKQENGKQEKGYTCINNLNEVLDLDLEKLFWEKDNINAFGPTIFEDFLKYKNEHNIISNYYTPDGWSIMNSTIVTEKQKKEYNEILNSYIINYTEIRNIDILGKYLEELLNKKYGLYTIEAILNLLYLLDDEQNIDLAIKEYYKQNHNEETYYLTRYAAFRFGRYGLEFLNNISNGKLTYEEHLAKEILERERKFHAPYKRVVPKEIKQKINILIKK